MTRGHLLVVGFGNPLMADDGVGWSVVERLRTRGLPRGVRAEDGGQDSLRLQALWGGEPEIWIADAFCLGAPAGTIHRLDHDGLLAVAQGHGSAHRLSLPESLRWLNHAFPEMREVRYRMWGVEPARLAAGEGLSPPVTRAAGAVALEILREYSRGAGASAPRAR